MFIALDENKNRISVKDAVKGHQYFCPLCGESVNIKAADSLAVRTHFAHKRGSDCDSFSHDMSEWHFQWQEKFPLENREVVIEKDGIKHRADVCINNTVIEFQHSPIKAEEIKARNDFYLSKGFDMVWVFDTDEKIKNEYGGPTDPCKCRGTDLCWSRSKQQFSLEIPDRVKIFLQYKTEVSIPELTGQKIDNLLLLTKPAPKNFEYLYTQVSHYYIYLLPQYFIKEYGGFVEKECWSISDILKDVEKTKLEIKRLQEENKRRKLNMAMNYFVRGGRRGGGRI